MYMRDACVGMGWGKDLMGVAGMPCTIASSCAVAAASPPVPRAPSLRSAGTGAVGSTGHYPQKLRELRSPGTEAGGTGRLGSLGVLESLGR